jgi:coenzyme F420-reducing hydrogenase alpha subunit
MPSGGQELKKRIKVDYLSRVEGEGGIYIEIKDGAIKRLDLKIFEAPRFFEPILKGRSFQDVIDFTSRICGICPVAYQMSAVHAIEVVLGIEMDETIRQLRRLFYAGEWIESHALHVYLLHGPDFYDIESSWTGKKYLPFLQRGLMLRRLGNELLSILGGRPVHPVSVRPGGFFSVPEKKRLRSLLPLFEKGYEEAIEGIRWAASLPDKTEEQAERQHEFVSLKDPEGYPMNRGKVISSGGMEMSMEEFLASIEEYQVEYSTALHSAMKVNPERKPYIVGPISRLNLNYNRLPGEIKTLIEGLGINLPITYVSRSIIARSIEIAYAIYEAVRIIRIYEEPEQVAALHPKKGKATWITEAPRGLLIHHYEFDRDGNVINARIIPPTSQNLPHIENTLYSFVTANINQPADHLRKGCERIVRSYDPCISCSVHLVFTGDEKATVR